MSDFKRLCESAVISTESFYDDIPDVILANYDLIENPNVLAIPKEFKAKVTDIGDEEPMYVTFAMPSGFSRYLEPETVGSEEVPEHPHRMWPEEVMFGFAEQIRERPGGIAGYGGHEGWLSSGEIPENIPVLWVSAIKSRRKSDEVGVTLARGYVTRHGNTREQIKLGIIDSASVSSVGNSKMKTLETEKGEDDIEYEEIQKGAALLSFDLVRKDTHGIPGTKLVANMREKESSMELTAEQKALIASLSSEQLKAWNPQLYGELADSKESAPEISKFYSEQMSLVKENVKLSRNAEVAALCATTMKCEVSELPTILAEMQTTHASIIAEAISLVVKDIANEELRKAISTELADAKPANVADVKAKFDEIGARNKAMAEMIAAENGLGSVPSAQLAGGTGDKVVASFLQAGGK